MIDYKAEAEKLVRDVTNKYGAVYPTSGLLDAIESLCRRGVAEAWEGAAGIVHRSGRIPKYDEFDNFHPSGEDIDPRFAQGWNAAVVALEDEIRSRKEEGR